MTRKELLIDITKDILLSEYIYDWDLITEKVERIGKLLTDNDTEYVELCKENPLFNYVRLIPLQNEEYKKAEIEINKFINNFYSAIDS